MNDGIRITAASLPQLRRPTVTTEGETIRPSVTAESWWFSVVDIIQVLTQQPDYQTARKYWNKLKEQLRKKSSQSVTNCHRLKLKEGSQSVANCNQLRLLAADGKQYLPDVANVETLLRLVQSVPSPKAKPITE